jgi:hypothetical protein
MEPPSSPPPLVIRRSKRRLDLGDFNTSDPVFSSDPAEPSLDVDRKTKRRYRGTWWGEENSKPLGPKAEYTRNVDSGVFLSSDDSLPSTAESSFREPRSPAVPRKLMQRIDDRPTGLLRAEKIITHCLDYQEEVVDLG